MGRSSGDRSFARGVSGITSLHASVRQNPPASKWNVTIRALFRSSALVVAGLVPLAAAGDGLALGDVTVTVDAHTGVATITGTDSADDVTVTWDGVDGAYTITGGAGTTIGGASSVSVTGVKSFVVTMGAGDDRVTFDHTPIPRDLNVHLDEGDDSLLGVGE